MANCNGSRDCTQTLTHIDHKGWVYCTDHAPRSDAWRRVRKMKVWEQKLIAAGKTIPSFRPTRKPVEARETMNASPAREDPSPGGRFGDGDYL